MGHSRGRLDRSLPRPQRLEDGSDLVTVVFSPSTDSADTGSTGGSGGTDRFDLGDVLVPLIAMAIPVGLVAAGVIYVGDRFLE